MLDKMKRKLTNMGLEKQEKCKKCNGSGWIKTGTRRENGITVPVLVPCDCQKKETDLVDETSDFIGRIFLDSPEKFRG